MIRQKNLAAQTMEEKLNTLRAGVLGSNDGILTVAGVLFSVGAATTNHFTLFIAGLSDLVACAFSMAAGEYASVSTQKDTEKSVVDSERKRLHTNFATELDHVVRYYVDKGVSATTARAIALELMHKRPLMTAVNVKHNIKLGHYMNPWLAAVASLFSAGLGGLLPLLAVTLLSGRALWIGMIFAVVVSVALTGFLSARLGEGFVRKAILRNIAVGIITMLIHYSVGLFF
ncbi:MAG: VIT family protein [Sporolactobacillus sp.]|jgi:VIT1/CCC1 family predicted Fe2+/Mn2+ transporter|nr:VIT family protein [Sporolactobacillus sp.]MCI1882976.1 VIT family protein [Sporolactobacillus sp.]